MRAQRFVRTWGVAVLRPCEEGATLASNDHAGLAQHAAPLQEENYFNRHDELAR